MNTLRIKAEKASISKCIDFISSNARTLLKGNEKNIKRAMLFAEEVIASMLQHALDSSEMKVDLSKSIINQSIEAKITIPGDAYDFFSTLTEADPRLTLSELEDSEAENTIRSIILNSYKDKIRFQHKNGKNIAILTLRRSENIQLHQTLSALVLALAVGILLRLFMPEAANNALKAYIFDPLSTMFTNAIKMVIAPVVFLSLTCCVASFGSLKELGKIGGKVMGMYLITTLIAITLGAFAAFITDIGDPELANYVTNTVQSTVEVAQTTNVSLISTIVAIIPSNFLKPFVESDMLAILFMAALFGIALSALGDSVATLKKILENLNTLFEKIMTIIVKFMPLAIFCALLSIIVSLDTSTIMSLLGWFILVCGTISSMVLVYWLLVFLFTGLNPLKTLKKMTKLWVTTFSLSSSNASIPTTMNTCEQLGIPKKLYSFSIPLGATINMDGCSIYVTISIFFMCNIFGITLTPGQIIPLFVTIILLSMAAPGVPGANMVCLVILLTQIGLPANAISLVIGLNSIMDMFITTINVTGDVMASLIVSKRSGMLDTSKYNS